MKIYIKLLGVSIIALSAIFAFGVRSAEAQTPARPIITSFTSTRTNSSANTITYQFKWSSENTSSVFVPFIDLPSGVSAVNTNTGAVIDGVSFELPSQGSLDIKFTNYKSISGTVSFALDPQPRDFSNIENYRKTITAYIPPSTLSPSINNLVPASADVGTSMTINGNNFLASNNTISLESISTTKGESGIRQFNVNSANGKTLSFVIPSTLLQSSEAYVGTKEVAVVSGKYQVSVSNDAGKSEPVQITVTDSKTSSCYVFNNNLQLGSRGDDVTALQKFLVSKGFKTDVSGYFGRTTYSALNKYQTSMGLPATGFFGPLTMAAVNGNCNNPIVPVQPQPVVCPAGYTCTPIITPDPQPITCRIGYVCPSVAVPSITSVAGMAAGNFEIDAGGKVGILGNYLAGNSINTTHVYIGGKQASIIQLGDSLIYATAPSDLIPGSMYDLYVSNEKGTSNSVQVKVLSTVMPSPVSNDCSISAPSVMNPSASPKLFNVDFGKWVPGVSSKSGPAIVGSAGDFWNTVAVPNCDSHNKVNLKNADGSSSQIAVEMSNLGGGWADMSGTVGINDPMLADFNYPTSNKGGNAYVTLSNVPQGTYDLYIYNKTSTSGQNGDYTVITPTGNYGHKTMTTDTDSYKATTWQENNQFVVFRGVRVDGGKIPILIQPSVGGFHDAQISGLQLAPAGTPAAVNYTQYQQQPDTNPVNRPPVINGVTAPVSLNVNQSGTWTVLASDPENSSLSYSVDWGDYACPPGYTCTTLPTSMIKSLVQTSTFTHSYASAGTYIVKFIVQDTAGQTAQTSATVQVGGISSQPAITVLSPNGGENITLGNTQTISWKSLGMSSGDSVRIELYKGGIYQNQIAFNQAVNGIYNWTPSISGKVLSGSDYKIRVVKAYDNSNSIYDESNAYFTISSPTTPDDLGLSIAFDKPQYAPNDVTKVTFSRVGTWPNQPSTIDVYANKSGDSSNQKIAGGLSVVQPNTYSINLANYPLFQKGDGQYIILVCAEGADCSLGNSTNKNRNGSVFEIKNIAQTSVSAPGTVNLIARIGGRTLSSSEANGCVATVIIPSGNGNTAGCSRTLTNQTPGTYQVQWNNGYPSGADTTKKPTISPSYPQSLGERPAGTNPITFYVDFQAAPTTGTQAQRSAASVIDSIGGFFSRLYGFDGN